MTFILYLVSTKSLFFGSKDWKYSFVFIIFFFYKKKNKLSDCRRDLLSLLKVIMSSQDKWFRKGNFSCCVQKKTDFVSLLQSLLEFYLWGSRSSSNGPCPLSETTGHKHKKENDTKELQCWPDKASLPFVYIFQRIAAAGGKPEGLPILGNSRFKETISGKG